MKIKNVKVYDLAECILASGYPMMTETYNEDNFRWESFPINYAIDYGLNNFEGYSKEVLSNHFNRATKLGICKKGTGHDQYLTGIRVNFDLTFTNKAWVELERYRFIEFVSSQSTMHKISSFDFNKQYNEYVDKRIIDIMLELKNKYNETKDKNDYLKLLYSNPAGFELTARLTTNYRALKTVYAQRREHKLPEWREFCEWILTLPYFKELCLGDNNGE